MINNFEKKVENPPKESPKVNFGGKVILFSILVPIFVAALTTLITIYLEREFNRPDIKILGVMPVHLYSSLKGPGKTEFPIHKLAFIFKVENSSPTSSIAHMAMFEGCIPLGPSIAEYHLPEDQRVPNGTIINVIYEKHKKTVQRISGASVIREDSQVIPGFEISYIGAYYSLPTQGAFHVIQDSISLNGVCKEI